MPEPELVCVKCLKPAEFYECAKVELEATVDLDVGYLDGKLAILSRRRVNPEHTSPGLSDVSSTEPGMTCANCDTHFDSVEDALIPAPTEHRCAECGWVGRQVWLHPYACDGEPEPVLLDPVPEGQEAMCLT